MPWIQDYINTNRKQKKAVSRKKGKRLKISVFHLPVFFWEGYK